MAGGCTVLAVILLLTGLPKANFPERHYREPGERETVAGGFMNTRERASEVSSRPGQTYTHTGTTNGNWTYCLSWQTQYGPASADIVVFYQPFQGTWGAADAQEPCFHGGTNQFTITNGPRPQVIRFVYEIRNVPYTDRVNPFSVGGTAEICERCAPLSEFDEVSNLEAIAASGQRTATWAVVPGIVAIASFIGFTTLIGLAYELGRKVFPSAAATRVRDTLEHAKHGGDFDPFATDAYDIPAETPFRRRQDIDDMKALTEEVRAETARLLRAEEKNLRTESAATSTNARNWSMNTKKP